MNTIGSFIRRSAAIAAILSASASAALAQGIVRAPHDWEMGFQAAGGPVQARIESLNSLIMWIITAITLLVAGLLGYVIWKFRASVHPTPSRVSHHTWLEVAWTILPALVLVVMAIPSFRLVYYENKTAHPDMTIKVTGHQWYWEYSYPDQGKLEFDSYMVPTSDLKPGQLRHLSVDNPLVIPAGENIRVLTTAADVIHSFFVPSLGVQRYAIPGRVIETWFRADKPGIYYGECNQICGTNHSVMPIEVHALTPKAFQAWLVTAKTKYAADASPPPPPTGGVRLAAVAH